MELNLKTNPKKTNDQTCKKSPPPPPKKKKKKVSLERMVRGLLHFVLHVISFIPEVYC